MKYNEERVRDSGGQRKRETLKMNMKIKIEMDVYFVPTCAPTGATGVSAIVV